VLRRLEHQHQHGQQVDDKEDLMSYRNNNYKEDYVRRHNINSKRPSNVTVIPREKEYVEKTIKRFMRKVKKSGIADEFRKRRFFEKPSIKKRRKSKQREARLRKLQAKGQI